MIIKGDRITAQWFEATPDTVLSGSQLKVGAVTRTVSGVVRHIRASRPDATHPEALFIDPDPGWSGPTMRPPRCTCPTEHVLVKPGWITSTEAQ